MTAQPNLLQRFIESGRDTSKFPRIKPVKSLDEIKKGESVWVLRGNKHTLMVGVVPKNIVNGSYIELNGGLVVEGHYDPDTRTLVGDTCPDCPTGVWRIRNGRITAYDVDHENVYLVN